MASCMGLPRVMERFGLIHKPIETDLKCFSLGSKLTYAHSPDLEPLKKIVAASERFVTPVEGELTNEVLFEHATSWTSRVRAIHAANPWKSKKKTKK